MLILSNIAWSPVWLDPPDKALLKNRIVASHLIRELYFIPIIRQATLSSIFFFIPNDICQGLREKIEGRRYGFGYVACEGTILKADINSIER